MDSEKQSREGAAGHSVLTVIENRTGEAPRVSLREEDSVAGGSSPVIDPRSEEKDALPRGRGTYQVLGEIARGGMGVVLKGHDTDLGRDVALKVLHRKLADRPEILRRFVEEAQIGGQLQHPGIVPVYELGLMADERPYFTMKLVKGKTLAALLQNRESVSADRRRLLDVFASVCQTVAYAHSRGVIHRDLKPANVMVGAFGEVQVVDWGLAKVLPRGERSAQPPGLEAREAATVLDTVRTGEGSSSSESLAGSVMGTPAYMAPEQAAGHVEKLDERTDVFSLGAILCEILTGAPPYLEESGEVLVQAANARLDHAHERLAACGAEPELVELAKQSLMPAQPARPGSAEVVAERVQRHRESVEERARRAQIEAAVQLRARKMTVALAATILVAAFGAGGGWLFLQEQAAASERQRAIDVNTALNEAALFRGRAEWDAAVAAAERARALAERERASGELLARTEELLVEIRNERDNARLLGDLEGVQLSSWGPSPDMAKVDRDYGEVFAMHGIEFEGARPEAIAESLRSRGLGPELASILDLWIQLRRLLGDSDGQLQLVEVAHRVDPDPVRADVREAILNEDVEALRWLAEEDLREHAPSTVLLLGFGLYRLGDLEESLRVGHAAVELYPDDPMLRHGLSMRLSNRGRFEETLPQLHAMVALLPESAFPRLRLADCYAALGEEALEGGDAQRADAFFRRAVASYASALELAPGDEAIRSGLERARGLTQGDDDE